MNDDEVSVAPDGTWWRPLGPCEPYLSLWVEGDETCDYEIVSFKWDSDEHCAVKLRDWIISAALDHEAVEPEVNIVAIDRLMLDLQVLRAMLVRKVESDKPTK